MAEVFKADTSGSVGSQRHKAPFAPGYLLDARRTLRLANRIVNTAGYPDLAVTRAVVFLTERCNMACVYCRSTRHLMPQWTRDRLLLLLEQWTQLGTRHIHWTGGEPTLYPDLSDLVRRSAASGMNNSISTNGASDIETYLRLVEAGMKRFYLSIDAVDVGRFDEMTRSNGYLPQVLQVLRSLCDMRDRGHDLHVTINTVLKGRVVADLMKNSGRLRDSGADDFKFLPASHEPASRLFPTREMRERFLLSCSESVPYRHRMFHHRISTMLNGGHGFRDPRERKCYQCVDDRAYDSIGSYACIIHLREGAAPIYLHEDPDDLKKNKLNTFLNQDRSRDPICRRCCFDLYRDLNEGVYNLLRQKTGEHK